MKQNGELKILGVAKWFAKSVRGISGCRNATDSLLYSSTDKMCTANETP